MTTEVKDTEVRIKPSWGAIDRALCCMILSREAGLSVHTREALKAVAQRLIRGQSVSREEWQRVVYSYVATQD